MVKIIFIVIIGLLIGVGVGYKYNFLSPVNLPTITLSKPDKIIMGFLPYWLVADAKTDYSSEFTNLAYFSLGVDSDGRIVKIVNNVENDPGWYALKSGKIDGVKDINTLVIFSGDSEVIDGLMQDPVTHANNLLADISPVATQHNFTGLNIDIESTHDASPAAQLAFTAFMQQLRSVWKGKLSIDVTASDSVKHNLVDVKQIVDFVDHIVVMDYDYHNPGSFVTGPNSPISGTETVAEFDTETAIKSLLSFMPASKIILAIPNYGYSWETLNDTPRSATIPQTGFSISTKKVAELLQNCNCTEQYDPVGQEAYLIYKDQDTETYHQVFYPNEKATQAKVDLANKYKLGGLAVWALGYEDDQVLNPLATYRAASNH